MSKERFKYYYNESVKRYEVFDCYVNLPLSKKGIIDTLNDQQDKISDLEAKLAESEKKFIVANNLRKNSDEVLLNYKTEKYGLDKTIQELREMKLSLPEKEWYYKGFENCERQMSSHIADLTLENNELKQQLAEKTLTIEQINKAFIENRSLWKCKYERANQEKISFAVERLKKVKEKVVKLKDYSRCDKYKECWDIIIDIIIDIDNQIKQLKEGN